MKKANTVLGALALTGMALMASTAIAGPVRGDVHVPTVEGLDHALNEARLALVELESNPELTVAQYKRGQADIVAAFIQEREEAYLAQRATEVLQCSAKASRPSLFGGRNTATCTIRTDTGKLAGWEYETHSAHLINQHSSGDNTYKVTVLDDKSGVELYVWVRSSSHDSFQGAGYLNQRVTVTYAMSEEEAHKRAASEAGALVLIS